MKVGLLGCHGFIGFNILRRLTQSGVDVVGIDRYSSLPPWRGEIPSSESFKMVVGDLMDPVVVEKNLRDVDKVIFAAGNPAPASNSFDLLFGEELRIVMSLLDSLAHYNPKAQLIFISSGGTVYGPRPHGHFCCEDEQLDPISMYGVMKLACEKAIAAYSVQFGLKTVILRLANPYGVGQNPYAHQGLIPVILKKILLREKIQLWGGLDVYRDYILAEDLCDLVEIIVNGSDESGVFNVGSGRGIPTSEIIDISIETTGLKPVIEICEARPQDLKWNALSIERTKERFNWTPKTPIESGIKILYGWIQNFSKELKGGK